MLKKGVNVRFSLLFFLLCVVITSPVLAMSIAPIEDVGRAYKQKKILKPPGDLSSGAGSFIGTAGEHLVISQVVAQQRRQSGRKRVKRADRKRMIRALSKVQAKSRKKRLPSRMRELKELRAIVIYRGKEPVELIPANPNLPALKPRRLRADEQYWPLRLSRDDILGLRDFSRQNEEEQTSILEELEDILRHLRDASKHRPLVKKDEKGDMPCVYLYKDKHLIDLYCSGDGPFLLEQLYRRQQH